MTQLIRIKSNSSTLFDFPIDTITGKYPTIFANNTLDIDVSLYQSGSVADVSSLASAKLEIKTVTHKWTPPLDSLAASASDTTTSFDNTLTDATWTARTKQHFSFTLTDDELNITPGNYWITCYVTTSGGANFTVFSGPLTILNPGTTAGL